MTSTLKLAAAFALTGFCFSANAQGTKPVSKTENMETKSEMKAETKKETTMQHAKGTKMVHHGSKMAHSKTVTKAKM